MRRPRYAAAKSRPVYGQPTTDPYMGWDKSLANYYRATVGAYVPPSVYQKGK